MSLATRPWQLIGRSALTAGLLLATAAYLARCAPAQRSVQVIDSTSAALVGVDEVLGLAEVPKPERWQLPNGLSVLFLEESEFPLVSGTLYLRGGSLWEPESSLGVVNCMGEQLRSGGAGGFSADALDLELEKLAASISSSYGSEYGSVSFLSLSSDFERVFRLFADVVLRPRFEKERLLVWKGQALESIRRRKDDPSTVAGLAFRQLLLGSSPYGRVSMEADIEAIGREQLFEAHQRYVKPAGAILAISGSTSAKLVRTLVEQEFAGWQVGPHQDWQPPPLNFSPESGIVFVRQPLAQATVLMGTPGPRRLPPDHHAIELFNTIFGASGFGSRLMQTVRTQMGLAYSIFGGVLPTFGYGRNLIMLQTKSESTAQAMREAMNILYDMGRDSVSEAELTDAKRNLVQSFVFNFDTIDKIVNRLAQLEIQGFPGDYDETFVPGIMSISSSEIAGVLRRHWNFNQLIIVVVGDEAAFESVKELTQGTAEPFAGLPLHEAKFGTRLEL